MWKDFSKKNKKKCEKEVSVTRDKDWDILSSYRSGYDKQVDGGQ